MKKIFSMLLVMACVLSFALPVSAAEIAANDDVKVSVSYDTEALAPSVLTDKGIAVNDDVKVSVSYDTEALAPSAITDKGISVDADKAPNAIAATVIDLGDGSVSIDWDIDAESSIRSQYDYKTNTEEINLRMLASPSSTSLTVYLYNSSGSRVASRTVTVGTIFNTTVTFSNLTASTNYYFEVDNNDQHDVSLSGSIFE